MPNVLELLSPETQAKAEQLAGRLTELSATRGGAAEKVRTIVAALDELQRLPATILQLERDLQDGANELANLILGDIAQQLRPPA